MGFGMWLIELLITFQMMPQLGDQQVAFLRSVKLWFLVMQRHFQWHDCMMLSFRDVFLPLGITCLNATVSADAATAPLSANSEAAAISVLDSATAGDGAS